MAYSRAVARVGRVRRSATGAPDEWPSPVFASATTGTEPGLQTVWPFSLAPSPHIACSGHGRSGMNHTMGDTFVSLAVRVVSYPGVIVGAQVGETSLLTRAGLTVAHAAAENLEAMEGGFGTHLLQRDLTTPCLMFGDGGVMASENYLALAGPGLGLTVDTDALSSL